MTRHLSSERGDGNGTPAGLRMSWPAVGVLGTFIGLLLTLTFAVRSWDMKALDEKIHSGQVNSQREVDLILRRLDRMEEKLDRALAER